MEKQEAIDFVFREIEKDRSEDEIVEGPSGLLGLPGYREALCQRQLLPAARRLSQSLRLLKSPS